MFAGDKSKPAADASYRNLSWENFHVDHSYNIGAKIQLEKEIGTINSWGPFYHLRFDLIIHSLLQEFITYSVITGPKFVFPDIYLHRSGFLQFEFGSVRFSYKIEVNHWYNISIQQKTFNGKVIKLYISDIIIVRSDIYH